ncbi:MAG TPA: hypothetical protein VFF20_10070 [Pseudogracilibacillus sp.]|nr:hypothetical protein [Pseudogracilibacillus sp.]
MTNEIERILKMVEEGKISAAEGSELIHLLKDKKEAVETKKTTAYSHKSVRIKVVAKDVQKVNVTIPLKVVQVFINLGKGIASAIPDADKYVEDIDFDVITEAIEQQIDGPIINVETEDGERVIISIE